MLGRRAGVVAQPGQAEVGARAVEQGQRADAERAVEHAVGDLVADVDELGRGEPARQLGGAHAAELELGAVDHVGVADLAGRAADLDVDAIVADQMAELLGQIGAEQPRPGDRAGVDAGLVEPGEGARRGRRRAFGLIGDAQLGVGEGADVAGVAVGADAVAGIGVERGAEIGDRAVVNGLQLVEDGGNLVDRCHAEQP